MSETAAVTELLEHVGAGSAAAEAELMERLHGELRRLAYVQLRRERATHTLQPTALVNEAYLRLLGPGKTSSWINRAQFLAHAACAMRQILVDYARRHRAEKRGGRQVIISLDDAVAQGHGPVTDHPGHGGLTPEELLDLDEALRALAAFDPRQAQIVNLRFFAGLDEGAIAHLLHTSERTVRRDWRTARLWLRRWFQHVHGA